MSTNVSNNQSFSTVVQKSQCPTIDQAIIVIVVDGVPLKEYALAMGKVVDPTQVIGFSRIAQKRFCYYLNSKILVNELLLMLLWKQN